MGLVRQSGVPAARFLSPESGALDLGIDPVDGCDAGLAAQSTAPVLLIHSRDDDYVVKDSMAQIYEHLGTADKEMLWVEGGGHVITEEPTRGRVFEAAANFIERVASAEFREKSA
ncbi:MAG: hypothetical protein COZ54_01355 [Anaerolineae bacterium CG_4_8_14_3_um_filter_59_70]|nr:MAG: hypothetical protein COZ54_01355 [Anaerolineae bacterium CG_4_8_14_3_um_filter_59_70]